MGFKVALEFDEPSDFFALLVKLAVPDDRVDVLIQRINAMSGSIQSVIDTLSANVQRLSSVEDSVQAFVEGVPGLIQTAVDQALAAGATPEQMQALNDLNTALSAKVDELASNVVANTPAEGGDDEQPAPDGEGTPPDATQPAPDTTVPPTVDPAVSPQA